MGTIQLAAALKPELVALELQLRNGDSPGAFATLILLDALVILREPQDALTFLSFTTEQLEDIHTRTAILRLAQSLIALAALHVPQPAPDL